VTKDQEERRLLQKKKGGTTPNDEPYESNLKGEAKVLEEDSKGLKGSSTKRKLVYTM